MSPLRGFKLGQQMRDDPQKLLRQREGQTQKRLDVLEQREKAKFQMLDAGIKESTVQALGVIEHDIDRMGMPERAMFDFLGDPETRMMISTGSSRALVDYFREYYQIAEPSTDVDVESELEDYMEAAEPSAHAIDAADSVGQTLGYRPRKERPGYVIPGEDESPFGTTPSRPPAGDDDTGFSLWREVLGYVGSLFTSDKGPTREGLVGGVEAAGRSLEERAQLRAQEQEKARQAPTTPAPVPRRGLVGETLIEEGIRTPEDPDPDRGRAGRQIGVERPGIEPADEEDAFRWANFLPWREGSVLPESDTPSARILDAAARTPFVNELLIAATQGLSWLEEGLKGVQQLPSAFWLKVAEERDWGPEEWTEFYGYLDQRYPDQPFKRAEIDKEPMDDRERAALIVNQLIDDYEHYGDPETGVISPTWRAEQARISKSAYERNQALGIAADSLWIGADTATFIGAMSLTGVGAGLTGTGAKGVAKATPTATQWGVGKTAQESLRRMVSPEQLTRLGLRGSFRFATSPGDINERLIQSATMVAYNITPFLAGATGATGWGARGIDYLLNTAITFPVYRDIYHAAGGINEQFWSEAIPQIALDMYFSHKTLGLPERTRAQKMARFRYDLASGETGMNLNDARTLVSKMDEAMKLGEQDTLDTYQKLFPNMTRGEVETAYNHDVQTYARHVNQLRDSTKQLMIEEGFPAQEDARGDIKLSTPEARSELEKRTAMEATNLASSMAKDAQSRIDSFQEKNKAAKDEGGSVWDKMPKEPVGDVHGKPLAEPSKTVPPSQALVQTVNTIERTFRDPSDNPRQTIERAIEGLETPEERGQAWRFAQARQQTVIPVETDRVFTDEELSRRSGEAPMPNLALRQGVWRDGSKAVREEQPKPEEEPVTWRAPVQKRMRGRERREQVRQRRDLGQEPEVRFQRADEAELRAEYSPRQEMVTAIGKIDQILQRPDENARTNIEATIGRLPDPDQPHVWRYVAVRQGDAGLFTSAELQEKHRGAEMPPVKKVGQRMEWDERRRGAEEWQPREETRVEKPPAEEKKGVSAEAVDRLEARMRSAEEQQKAEEERTEQARRQELDKLQREQEAEEAAKPATREEVRQLLEREDDAKIIRESNEFLQAREQGLSETEAAIKVPIVNNLVRDLRVEKQSEEIDRAIEEAREEDKPELEKRRASITRQREMMYAAERTREMAPQAKQDAERAERERLKGITGEKYEIIKQAKRDPEAALQRVSTEEAKETPRLSKEDTKELRWAIEEMGKEERYRKAAHTERPDKIRYKKGIGTPTVRFDEPTKTPDGALDLKAETNLLRHMARDIKDRIDKFNRDPIAFSHLGSPTDLRHSLAARVLRIMRDPTPGAAEAIARVHGDLRNIFKEQHWIWKEPELQKRGLGFDYEQRRDPLSPPQRVIDRMVGGTYLLPNTKEQHERKMDSHRKEQEANLSKPTKPPPGMESKAIVKNAEDIPAYTIMNAAKESKRNPHTPEERREIVRILESEVEGRFSPPKEGEGTPYSHFEVFGRPMTRNADGELVSVDTAGLRPDKVLAKHFPIAQDAFTYFMARHVDKDYARNQIMKKALMDPRAAERELNKVLKRMDEFRTSVFYRDDYLMGERFLWEKGLSDAEFRAKVEQAEGTRHRDMLFTRQEELDLRAHIAAGREKMKAAKKDLRHLSNKDTMDRAIKTDVEKWFDKFRQGVDLSRADANSILMEAPKAEQDLRAYHEAMLYARDQVRDEITDTVMRTFDEADRRIHNRRVAIANLKREAERDVARAQYKKDLPEVPTGKDMGYPRRDWEQLNEFVITVREMNPNDREALDIPKNIVDSVVKGKVTPDSAKNLMKALRHREIDRAVGNQRHAKATKKRIYKGEEHVEFARTPGLAVVRHEHKPKDAETRPSYTYSLKIMSTGEFIKDRADHKPLEFTDRVDADRTAFRLAGGIWNVSKRDFMEANRGLFTDDKEYYKWIREQIQRDKDDRILDQSVLNIRYGRDLDNMVRKAKLNQGSYLWEEYPRKNVRDAAKLDAPKPAHVPRNKWPGPESAWSLKLPLTSGRDRKGPILRNVPGGKGRQQVVFKVTDPDGDERTLAIDARLVENAERAGHDLFWRASSDHVMARRDKDTPSLDRGYSVMVKDGKKFVGFIPVERIPGDYNKYEGELLRVPRENYSKVEHKKAAAFYGEADKLSNPKTDVRDDEPELVYGDSERSGHLRQPTKGLVGHAPPKRTRRFKEKSRDIIQLHGRIERTFGVKIAAGVERLRDPRHKEPSRKGLYLRRSGITRLDKKSYSSVQAVTHEFGHHIERWLQPHAGLPAKEYKMAWDAFWENNPGIRDAIDQMPYVKYLGVNKPRMTDEAKRSEGIADFTQYWLRYSDEALDAMGPQFRTLNEWFRGALTAVNTEGLNMYKHDRIQWTNGELYHAMEALREDIRYYESQNTLEAVNSFIKAPPGRQGFSWTGIHARMQDVQTNWVDNLHPLSWLGSGKTPFDRTLHPEDDPHVQAILGKRWQGEMSQFTAAGKGYGPRRLVQETDSTGRVIRETYSEPTTKSLFQVRKEIETRNKKPAWVPTPDQLRTLLAGGKVEEKDKYRGDNVVDSTQFMVWLRADEMETTAQQRYAKGKDPYPMPKHGMTKAQYSAYAEKNRLMHEAAGLDPKTGEETRDHNYDAQSRTTLKQWWTSAKDMHKYFEEVLHLYVERGMMKEQTFNRIRGEHPSYIPFFRYDENMPVQSGHERIGSTHKGLFEMEGSQKPIIDPWLAAMDYTETAIRQTKNNQVMIKIAEQLRGMKSIYTGDPKVAANPKHGVDEVPMPVREIRITGDELRDALKSVKDDDDMVMLGKVIEQVIKRKQIDNQDPTASFGLTIWGDKMPLAKDNMVTFYEKDEVKVLEFMDPQIVRALQGLGEDQVGALGTFGRYLAHGVRVGNVLSHRFPFWNFFRDQPIAGMYSKHGYVPFLDGLRGYAEYIRKGPNFHEWFRAGGPMATLDTLDTDLPVRGLEKLTRDKWQTMLNRAVTPWTLWKRLVVGAEYATNLGEYMKARKRGASIAGAAFDGGDITVNHKRHGAQTHFLRSQIPFWNSSVQANVKMIRQFREKPLATAWKAFLFITLPSVADFMTNSDNPEYQSMAWWQRDLFYNIPIGDSRSTNLFLPIPKPFLPGMLFGTVPQRFLQFMKYDDPAAFEDLRNSVLGFLAPNMSIPFLSHLYEQYSNHKIFTGTPIVPARELDHPAPDQFGPLTSEVAKHMGKALDWSPRRIDHITSGMFGLGGRGLVSLTDGMIGPAYNVPDPVPSSISDYPIAGDFFRETSIHGSNDLTRFYADKQRATEEKTKIDNKLQRGEIGPGDRISEEGQMWMDAYDDLNKIDRQLATLRSHLREVHAHPDMTPEDKRYWIDTIEADMTNLVRHYQGKTPVEKGLYYEQHLK